jgi:hypothetical protein
LWQKLFGHQKELCKENETRSSRTAETDGLRGHMPKGTLRAKTDRLAEIAEIGATGRTPQAPAK